MIKNEILSKIINECVQKNKENINISEDKKIDILLNELHLKEKEIDFFSTFLLTEMEKIDKEQG